MMGIRQQSEHGVGRVEWWRRRDNEVDGADREDGGHVEAAAGWPSGGEREKEQSGRAVSGVDTYEL